MQSSIAPIVLGESNLIALVNWVRWWDEIQNRMIKTELKDRIDLLSIYPNLESLYERMFRILSDSTVKDSPDYLEWATYPMIEISQWGERKTITGDRPIWEEQVYFAWNVYLSQEIWSDILLPWDHDYDLRLPGGEENLADYYKKAGASHAKSIVHAYNGNVFGVSNFAIRLQQKDWKVVWTRMNEIVAAKLRKYLEQIEKIGKK